MKKTKLSVFLLALLFQTFNLQAKSEVEEKLFSIMTGQPSSEYHFLQDLHYLSKLQPRIEDTLGNKISSDFALAIAACIRSSSHPTNPDTVLLGVVFNKIDSEKAIAYCELAYAMGGDKVGMVVTSLSRAYTKAERYEKSLKLAKEAIRLGYPFGNVMMAIHYNYALGVEKNEKRSFDWYKKAAEKGITGAMRATTDNYLKSNGTPKDLDKALYWSKKAISSNDGKGFYQLGKVLEAFAQTKAKRNRYKLLSLASEIYHLASYNGIYVRRDFNRISQIINPNGIHKSPILSKAKKSGHVIDGIFFPNEADSYWYLGDAVSSEDPNQYAYARVSHSNSVFTIWSKYSAVSAKTEWYAEFLYTGNGKLNSFEYIAVKTKNDRQVRLNISDPLLTQLAGSYRMTAKLNFNDVWYLLTAPSVKIGYTTKKPAKSRSYSLALNQENTQAADQQKYSAKQVIGRLIINADRQNKKCCNLTGLVPLDPPYNAFQYLCSSKQSDLDTTNRMKYNCDRIAIYGSDKDREAALEGTYMQQYVADLIKRINQSLR
ncbi:MAG: tetratricopeptide repeat protein [Enterobacterales bacterium]|nr:tetratricopeptide repeat protein [Enterobacterales bacterium]